MPTYVRRSQAAKLLGIHSNTLTNWERAGIITPALRMPGGEARFTVEDIERLAADMAAVREKAE